MKITLAIIGLGQIGASVGMALAEQKQLIRRVGYDLNPAVARQALQLGAVERAAASLSAAVADADAVLLALPGDQIRPTLAQIAPNIHPETVLMDTALSKEQVAGWAAELLPARCCYVGLTPVINPAYLVSEASGIEGARPDLFENGMIAISCPPGTASRAIKLAADLTRLLGAAVFFADLLEVDSMMTATHIVPQLMAAALLNATVGQPNWREVGRMAGRAYAEVSGPIEHLGPPGALAATALQNREHALRVLNSVIAALENLRDEIELKDGAALTERLARAHKGRDLWLAARLAGSAAPEIAPLPKPSQASSLFGNLLRTGSLSQDRE